MRRRQIQQNAEKRGIVRERMNEEKSWIWKIDISSPGTCRRREGNGIPGDSLTRAKRFHTVWEKEDRWKDSRRARRIRQGRRERMTGGEEPMQRTERGRAVYRVFVWRIINANDTDIESAYNHAAGLIAWTLTYSNNRRELYHPGIKTIRRTPGLFEFCRHAVFVARK